MLIESQVKLVPRYVGYYQFGDLRLSFKRRPSRWHQFWMRVCLDFIWHGEPDEYLAPNLRAQQAPRSTPLYCARARGTVL